MNGIRAKESLNYGWDGEIPSNVKEKLPFDTGTPRPSATYEAKDTSGFAFDEVLDFSKFEPMFGAIEAVHKIIDMGHDVFIASTPPWNYW